MAVSRVRLERPVRQELQAPMVPMAQSDLLDLQAWRDLLDLLARTALMARSDLLVQPGRSVRQVLPGRMARMARTAQSGLLVRSGQLVRQVLLGRTARTESMVRSVLLVRSGQLVRQALPV
jgi:hypothetical protein